MSDRIDDIRTRLEGIGEELSDAAIDLLREAVADGATERPPQEKPLAQARRAIEKAVRALDGVS